MEMAGTLREMCDFCSRDLQELGSGIEIKLTCEPGVQILPTPQAALPSSFVAALPTAATADTAASAAMCASFLASLTAAAVTFRAMPPA